MIFNKHLDRLIEVEIVSRFMSHQHMSGKLCSNGDDSGFILYRLPYVIEFRDALVENFLDISISEMHSGLMLSGGAALGCSVDIGLQNIEVVRSRNLEADAARSIFLSEGHLKTRNLYSNLEAIDKLLPLIEAKGGLSSMRNGTFDSRFDFSDSVQPMYPGLKERYLKCIGLNDS